MSYKLGGQNYYWIKKQFYFEDRNLKLGFLYFQTFLLYFILLLLGIELRPPACLSVLYSELHAPQFIFIRSLSSFVFVSPNNFFPVSGFLPYKVD